MTDIFPIALADKDAYFICFANEYEYQKMNIKR